MGGIALYSHEACGRHDTGWGHPEHQGRLRAVMSALEQALPELHPAVTSVRGTPVGREPLERTHASAYLDRVEAADRRAAESGRAVRLDPDTVASGHSWAAARAASGCAVDAVEAVCAGKYGSAFCATRPPGHHATPDRAMGFCLLNHVAVAARHALDGGLAARVLIVDWDVHHGNGTQEIFWEDPDVFYLSLHQSPWYPGTGAAQERGAGPGEGTTLNIPMGPGHPPERYVEAVLEGLDRALETFEPELVLVSAGFDAARDDPLGGFTLDPAHYAELTLALGRRTAGNAEGRIVSVLEGGYNPEELGRNVVAHVRALRDLAGELREVGG